MGLWSKEGASGLLVDVKLFDLIHRSIKKMSKILSHKDVCHTLHDRFSPLLCFLNFYDFFHFTHDTRDICLFLCKVAGVFYRQTAAGKQGDKRLATAQIHSSVAAQSDDQRKVVRTHTHRHAHPMLSFSLLKNVFRFGSKETRYISTAVLY